MTTSSVAAIGCTKQPHVILQIEDPDGVADGADELSIGVPESTLSERMPLPHGFPVSLVLKSEQVRKSPVLLEARRDQVVVGRARVEVEFRTDAARTAIVRLGRACASPADCDDGVYCNGAEVCTAGGICAPGGDPCRALQFPCVVLSCDEAGYQCEVHVDPALDDGDPCTRDLCSGDGVIHLTHDDGETCHEPGVLPPSFCLAGTCKTLFADPIEWTLIAGGLSDSYVHALAIDPANPSTSYAGTAEGVVFKSTDGGTSWSPATAGLTTSEVRALAIDPTKPSILYAGTDGGGVFKTTDQGGSWNASNSGLTTFDVRALAIDPANPSTLYAGTTGGGVFRSTDEGASWNSANAGLTNPNVRTLAIDPTNPSILYAGTFGGLGTAGYGVLRSMDQGASWFSVNAGLTAFEVWALAIDLVNPSTLYAGAPGLGVFRSMDRGASWHVVNAGLENPNVRALAIDPANPNKLYAGTSGGVYRGTVHP